MLDIFKAMSGGPRNWVLGWLLPAALFCSAVGFFLVPRYAAFPLPKDATERALMLVGAVILLGLVMSALSVQLYQVLEGSLLWPSWIQRRRIKAHQENRVRLLQQAYPASAPREEESVSEGAERESVEGKLALEDARVLERLYGYPVDPGQIAPTRFGNALRSFETYGYDRYMLDSQSLWDELISVVPENLRQEEANSRAPVDFFVATLWFDVLYLVLTAITLVRDGVDGGLIAALVIGGAILPLSYFVAIRSCVGWAQAVRAVVNLGRKPLAASLGLVLPHTIEAEREMWRAVGWFVADFYEAQSARSVDAWRAPGPSAGVAGSEKD